MVWGYICVTHVHGMCYSDLFKFMGENYIFQNYHVPKYGLFKFELRIESNIC